MPVVNSIKPAKPRKDFPLFAHGSGMWAKKIRKRTLYFTSWRQDPTGEAALEQFEREWPYLKKGETPPNIDVSNGCALRQLVNSFLEDKESYMASNELAPRTFQSYYNVCEALIEHFGKDRRIDDLKPDDFRAYRTKLAKRFGVVALKNSINYTRILFNYAYKNNLMTKLPSALFGSSFDRPSDKALRGERNTTGAKLFTRKEVLDILAEADVQLRAMMMLGINCGFGNTDVSSLPLAAIDLDAGWVTFPRPKTQIKRRMPLWPETVAAIRSWLAVRREPKDGAYKHLVFLTRLGQPWVRVTKKEREDGSQCDTFTATDAVSGQFGKLLRLLKINGRRGLGFYTLRHCFETEAGECKDQVAVDAVMGHVDNSMSANYRHKISDERLMAAVNTVRGWLYGKAEGGAA
jgi:integrase